MEPKSTRNADIIRDRKELKMTWRKLMDKYGLSLTRLQYIVKRGTVK